MKHTVNFYIEKRKSNKSNDTPILMFVSFGGKRVQYYTGERCAPTQWVDKSKYEDKVQRVKRNNITPANETSANINRRLENLESEVNRLFAIYEEKNEEPTKETLKAALDIFLGKSKIEETKELSLFERYDQYLEQSNFSYSRKKNLKSGKGKLMAYSPNVTFDEITPQYLTNYQNYLINLRLSKNSVSTQLKYLRAFLNHANKMKWTDNYPFNSFAIDKETYGDPVYITLKERDLLFDAEIKKDYLRRVRDIFVFQCLIGCRVGDLLKLKKSNIVDGCIEYIAAKTKDDKPRKARVPLSEKAKIILARYDLPGNELLPFISSQKYNDYIKELFKAVELTRIVTVRNPKTGEGEQKPICDIASSHMARRVFVGGLYGKGVKNEIIASMSGHIQDSKSFMRYYTIERQNQIDAIKAIE